MAAMQYCPRLLLMRVLCMNWFSVQSANDLKKLGKFQEVKKNIQNELTNSIQIKARGWNDLFRIISKLNELKNNNKIDICFENKDENVYFTSEASRYIYSLVELSGEFQLKELGISRVHLRDKSKAKSLRNKIAHEIHPDKCKHPKASEAMEELNNLFKEVVS